jgi:CMP-N,N'-diacetyllegionaminic acid synthase
VLVGLIPARAGSKRIPGKNMKLLGGKPLMQWTIDAAQAAGIFQDVCVCTDDDEAATMAKALGVRLIERPPSGDDEPDIVWVQQALKVLAYYPDAFAILRPTSPFRTGETIRRAWHKFKRETGADSLRAVTQWTGPHPGKMWRYDDVQGRITPLINEWTAKAPYHSSPPQKLPPVYTQNASLEIAWTRTVQDSGTIAGTRIVPFFTQGLEGFDINTPDDWARAEAHAETLLASV